MVAVVALFEPQWPLLSGPATTAVTTMEIHMALDLAPFSSKVTYDSSTGQIRSVATGTLYQNKDRDGYIRIRLDRKCLGAHRLAWFCHHGENPNGEIDHINGDRSDNRICNLRVASRSENMQNARTPRTNSSGYHGVSWCTSGKKWTAQIWKDGKRYRLGSFVSPEVAHQAYLAAKAALHNRSPKIKDGKLVHESVPQSRSHGDSK